MTDQCVNGHYSFVYHDTDVSYFLPFPVHACPTETMMKRQTDITINFHFSVKYIIDLNCFHGENGPNVQKDEHV